MIVELVLVTGSRRLRPGDNHAIYQLLDGVLADRPGMVLLHGACRQGVDAVADRWAQLREVSVERHPARWQLGRGAGMARSRAMVKREPVLCVAWINPCVDRTCDVGEAHGSHGGSRCAEFAAACQVPLLGHCFRCAAVGGVRLWKPERGPVAWVLCRRCWELRSLASAAGVQLKLGVDGGAA